MRPPVFSFLLASDALHDAQRGVAERQKDSAVLIDLMDPQLADSRCREEANHLLDIEI